MRLYQPSWLELKKSPLSPKRIRISAPSIFHKRIYKAIIKEKDMDRDYKKSLNKEWKYAVLSTTSRGGLLEIRMDIICWNVRISIEDF